MATAERMMAGMPVPCSPIYFSVTVGNSPKSYFWLSDYFQLEGLAYKFVPVHNPTPKGSVDFGKVNSDIMYDNMMNKFQWRNLNDPSIFYDENYQRFTVSERLERLLEPQGEANADRAKALAGAAVLARQSGDAVAARDTRYMSRFGSHL